ncbi:DUF3558 domain-containing protein [Saccharothrix saharensis]|uniref:DUF3558 domain-containing protein n=1 Tax=Saccharothrix saharensis TaxID=571190 RepID=UPI003691A5C7
MRRVVPLIAALALLAGCSQPTDGSANPGGSTPTTTADGPTSGKPTSALKEPAKRPKTINIEDVDPCTLLTEAQRAEFGLDQPPVKDDVPGKPGCSMSRGDRTHSVAIYANSTEGIETYTEPSRPGSTTLQVGGFPAVMIEAKNALGFACAIHLDVSDGQLVTVQSHSLDVDPQALCQVVQPAAGAVVTNLMSK